MTIVTLPKRKLGKDGPEITALGLGLMGLSIAYGTTGSDEERLKFLDRAWELGATNWDTSDAYGDNEDLLGKWFALHPERRKDIFLATKFGGKAVTDADGNPSFVIDSSPEYSRVACDQSLKRLGVDLIDLYYIHRLDEKTPIEKTIQEMVNLKDEGKIKYLGISECSSTTLRRACAVHPIHAVQVEYSPWTLDIEGPVGTHLLQAARELGVSVVAYSPLGRGILTGRYKSVEDFEENDYRRVVERYQGDNLQRNVASVQKYEELATRKGCTVSQLVLAWILAQGYDFIPIPGTKKIGYLEENLGALNVVLTEEEVATMRSLVKAEDVAGGRGISVNEYADTPSL